MTQDRTLSETKQVDTAEAIAFLETLLQQQVAAGTFEWLDQQRQKIRNEEKGKLFLAFSLASRYFDSSALLLTAEQIDEANKLRAGFMPQYWNHLQAARVLLLLELSRQEAEAYTDSLARLAETADVAEQTALYAALPVLPHPRALQKRAAEGIRTNMTVVFDAIALHNPYPADYLEDGPWNQMVLKAVFMGRPLYQIWGAEKRANPALAQMLLDFAHERWAAHRTVTPELWRFIGPYLQQQSLTDIEKVCREGTALECDAVLLACASSTLPGAQNLLDQHPETARKVKAGEINWSTIGQQYNIQ